ncbi:hypothetical protein [Gemmatimonas sp.]|jgi:hypothetical protein|uniref:hypothetical protein n=1 Tax=Gemmatimonas sp. TaxID=1962908 RepID=UPI0022C48525|nr:hypothetical protein [Gemmatimonas sp.]MCA2984202.1 carboxypeptidase regulatory-like domain-containing protein [Gemmatimonas sp.]MCA2996665.1 carboxypeptidase regulatory-like domain-containing protein [Gemmatimonas sp.]MCE2954529.1 hypothetical protein [Gemmatimonas sp.]MCZ8010372.1 hypothetical protein [Gemmatimonas sp.]MCZ8266935.1 hypothetical protein [Gemmatimonas sp.]
MLNIIRFVLQSITLAATMMAWAANEAQAQGAQPTFTLRVNVTDTAGNALADTEVLVRSANRISASGRTGRAGVWTGSFTGESPTVEIVVRKLGFQPVDSPLQLSPNDTLNLQIALTPSIQTLGTVEVRARESLRRQAYFLDSDAIVGSKRRIRNALDAMVQLRPYMITSMSGPGSSCGVIREVWINGVQVPKTFVPDPRMVNRALPGLPRNAVSPVVLTILSSVRPEHIEQMNYVDCYGGPVAAVGSRNAVFIMLKEGVEYRWPDGTFAVSEGKSRR